MIPFSISSREKKTTKLETQVATTRPDSAVVAATGRHAADALEDTGSRQLCPVCGVRVEQQKDGGILLSGSDFVDELREVRIPSHRGKEKYRPVTHKNKQS